MAHIFPSEITVNDLKCPSVVPETFPILAPFSLEVHWYIPMGARTTRHGVAEGEFGATTRIVATGEFPASFTATLSLESSEFEFDPATWWASTDAAKTQVSLETRVRRTTGGVELDVLTRDEKNAGRVSRHRIGKLSRVLYRYSIEMAEPDYNAFAMDILGWLTSLHLKAEPIRFFGESLQAFVKAGEPSFGFVVPASWVPETVAPGVVELQMDGDLNSSSVFVSCFRSTNNGDVYTTLKSIVDILGARGRAFEGSPIQPFQQIGDFYFWCAHMPGSTNKHEALSILTGSTRSGEVVQIVAIANERESNPQAYGRTRRVVELLLRSMWIRGTSQFRLHAPDTQSVKGVLQLPPTVRIFVPEKGNSAEGQSRAGWQEKEFDLLAIGASDHGECDVLAVDGSAEHLAHWRGILVGPIGQKLADLAFRGRLGDFFGKLRQPGLDQFFGNSSTIWLGAEHCLRWEIWKNTGEDANQEVVDLIANPR